MILPQSWGRFSDDLARQGPEDCDRGGTSEGSLRGLSYQASHGGTPLYSVTYDDAAAPRDGLGRVVQKTETIEGMTHVYGYTYDEQGRLTDLGKDGVLEEHYEYDLNGNRTLAIVGGEETSGVYDDQDRLLSYGDNTYAYTANGELLTKTGPEGTTTYGYDAQGSLVAIELPDGRFVEYITDGLGRRVGKRVDGVLVQQWLYRDSLKPVAELDGSGSLVAQYVYGTKPNVPDYVVRGGNTYRVLSDQLGSPVLAVNVADSADVPFRAEYSAFGNVTGAGLEWMPFGFAGGQYDADTGLVRFAARDYGPGVGRWTAKDPIRFGSPGEVNLLVYVDNDPANALDFTGLSKFDKLWGLPKKFWRWYHRQRKDPGEPDLDERDARDLYDEWQKLGTPGPDKKKPRRRPDDDGFGADDLLDMISLPPIPSCLLDLSCGCGPQTA